MEEGIACQSARRGYDTKRPARRIFGPIILPVIEFYLQMVPLEHSEFFVGHDVHLLVAQNWRCEGIVNLVGAGRRRSKGSMIQHPLQLHLRFLDSFVSGLHNWQGRKGFPTPRFGEVQLPGRKAVSFILAFVVLGVSSALAQTENIPRVLPEESNRTTQLREAVDAEIDALASRLFELNDWMYHNPESGFLEFEASRRLTEELQRKGTFFPGSYNRLLGRQLVDCSQILGKLQQ